jgi:hypothetical protein
MTERNRNYHLRRRKQADEVIADVAWLLRCRSFTGLNGRDIERINMEHAGMSAGVLCETKGLVRIGEAKTIQRQCSQVKRP